MSLLKNVDTDKVITRFVSLDDKQDVNRSVNILLSGSEYIQNIGNPTVNYSVVAYVDRNGKALLREAEDKASLLRVVVNHGEYLGRIKELKFGDRLAGDWFEANLLLAKEVLIV